MDTIWYRDLGHFFSINELPKFIPTKDMTFTQQLNAIMRFSIYFSILLFVVNRNLLVFYIVLFVALLTMFLYELYHKNKEHQKQLYEKLSMYYDKRNKKLCVKPSPENPFMNVLMNEYNEFPNRPEACNLSNSRVKKEAEKFFENNLYKDVDDIWSRKTSSRNWHTVPVTTIPNDRETFTKWLYDIKPTCKEGNGNQCFRNLHQNFKI